MLSGVTRMTISLCVIMLEATRDVTYALPVILTIFVSKAVGDIFNQSLYAFHIQHTSIPFLGWDTPLITRKFEAKDVMNSPVVTLKRIHKGCDKKLN